MHSLSKEAGFFSPLSSDDASKKILVYVQALPSFIPSSARKFSDLETADFRMSHSSKAALALAAKYSRKIVAAGFSPILREAVARGASDIFPMPLCDDPLQQVSFFPKKSYSGVFVGENPDWLFSGMSLAGLIASKWDFGIQVSSQGQISVDDSVTIVEDSGEVVPNIDIRRIELAQEATSHPEGVLGEASIRRLEETKTESLSGFPDETSSVISRRLRRITRG